MPEQLPRLRIRFVVDDDGQRDQENLHGSPLPGPESEYTGNEVCQLIDPADDPVAGARRTVPYAEYCQYWGNPDRHVVLGAIVELECPCCKHWSAGPSLWSIDFMDDSPEVTGKLGVRYDELDTPKRYRHYYAPEDLMPGYLAEVASQLFEEAKENPDGEWFDGYEER